MQCCDASTVTASATAASSSPDISLVFKALADPTRLRLIEMINASECHEACVCNLTEPVGLSQPTVSHHLRQLVDAGLLTREQRGKWAYYAVVPATIAAAAQALTAMVEPPEPAGRTPAR